MKLHGSDDWAPLPEFIDPIMQRGLRDNDHVWASNTAILMQVTQKGYGLKSLSQTLHQQPKLIHHYMAMSLLKEGNLYFVLICSRDAR